MKTYSVNKIADMLKTNPETVRRWIRSGKLKATQTSRKGGNEVTEGSLQEFLKSAPKYAKIAGIAVAGSFLPPGLGFSLTLPMIMNIISNEILVNNLQISLLDIEKSIEECVKDSTKTIAKKKEEIKNIQQEISYEENKIVELKKYLEEIQSLNDEQKGD